jgi:hypothetical protein
MIRCRMSRITVETLSNIDVNELNRLGAFARPMEYPFRGLRTSPSLIEYRSQGSPTDRPPQRIPIQWTWCKYGGARPWLMCQCGRRVGKLYYGNGFLGCRHCAGATYASQRRSRRARLHLKAAQIRQRLGDDGRPCIDAIPPRPSGMHRKIYSRLRAELNSIELQLIEGGIYRPRPRRRQHYYARTA